MNTLGGCVQRICVPFGDGDVGWGAGCGVGAVPLQDCYSSGNDQENKFRHQGQGKVREFCFESGKIDIFKKSQEKLI